MNRNHVGDWNRSPSQYSCWAMKFRQSLVAFLSRLRISDFSIFFSFFLLSSCSWHISVTRSKLTYGDWELPRRSQRICVFTHLLNLSCKLFRINLYMVIYFFTNLHNRQKNLCFCTSVFFLLIISVLVFIKASKICVKSGFFFRNFFIFLMLFKLKNWLKVCNIFRCSMWYLQIKKKCWLHRKIYKLLFGLIIINVISNEIGLTRWMSH